MNEHNWVDLLQKHLYQVHFLTPRQVEEVVQELKEIEITEVAFDDNIRSVSSEIKSFQPDEIKPELYTKRLRDW